MVMRQVTNFIGRKSEDTLDGGDGSDALDSIPCNDQTSGSRLAMMSYGNFGDDSAMGGCVNDISCTWQ